jgi:hypothetical protein
LREHNDGVSLNVESVLEELIRFLEIVHYLIYYIHAPMHFDSVIAA